MDIGEKYRVTDTIGHWMNRRDKMDDAQGQAGFTVCLPVNLPYTLWADYVASKHGRTRLQTQPYDQS